MRKLLLAAALLIPLAGAARALNRSAEAQAAPANAALETKVHAGQEVFLRSCMQCHAVNEGQYSFGPNLYGELKKPHPKKSPAEVKEILMKGKGKMPAYADKLAPTDIENLVAYLHTL